ncbi:MAG: hypothetical protein J6A46_02975 [Clostridia bacterium]|nr:hypothetical protein [Clostridia bacterium]
MKGKTSVKTQTVRSAKELARTAVFVAAVIGVQYALSALPFVEIVTLLFACYAYVFGGVRGVVAAVAFSFLRQLIFGFYPVVLILYVVHFSFLSLLFGALRRSKLSGWKLIFTSVLVAAAATACFTLLDNILTPVYYGYTPKAAKMYFMASLPFLMGQTICAGVSVGALFLPIVKAMFFVKIA